MNRSDKKLTLTCVDCGEKRTVYVRNPKKPPERCYPCAMKRNPYGRHGSELPMKKARPVQ